MNKVMIAVAPNGARRTPADHPAIPVTGEQLAETAAQCRDAGACMIHLHVRDRKMEHSLDPDLYKEAIQKIRAKVHMGLIVQITTEAVGRYKPDEQMAVVKRVRPEAVSLALRELCPATAEESPAAKFFEWVYREHIMAQFILYDAPDIQRFLDFRRRGLIPGDQAMVLLVLGRYTATQESDPADLPPLAAALTPDTLWGVCAFGSKELDCMESAMGLDGHCRVGFENNLYLPGGKLAPDNGALVTGVVSRAEALSRPPADAEEARALLARTLPP